MCRSTSSRDRGATLLVVLVALLGAITFMVGLVRVGEADIDRQHAQRSADLAVRAAARRLMDVEPGTDRTGPGLAARRAAIAAAVADGAVVRSLVVQSERVTIDVMVASADPGREPARARSAAIVTESGIRLVAP